MKNKGKIPDRWEMYTAFGKQLEGTRLIAFKVPLNNNAPVKEEMTTDTLLAKIPNLGLVIDLTNTNRYYNGDSLIEKGVMHTKLMVQGHVTPKLQIRNQFRQYVKDFLANNSQNDKLIGVHCTHGVNRTGALICNYLVMDMNMNAKEAINRFESARGHRIARENYVEMIHEAQKIRNGEVSNQAKPARSRQFNETRNIGPPRRQGTRWSPPRRMEYPARGSDNGRVNPPGRYGNRQSSPRHYTQHDTRFDSRNFQHERQQPDDDGWSPVTKRFRNADGWSQQYRPTHSSPPRNERLPRQEPPPPFRRQSPPSRNERLPRQEPPPPFRRQSPPSRNERLPRQEPPPRLDRSHDDRSNRRHSPPFRRHSPPSRNERLPRQEPPPRYDRSHDDRSATKQSPQSRKRSLSRPEEPISKVAKINISHNDAGKNYPPNPEKQPFYPRRGSNRDYSPIGENPPAFHALSQSANQFMPSFMRNGNNQPVKDTSQNQQTFTWKKQ